MSALRVLHVDDEPDIREVVEVSLGLDPDVTTRSCGSGGEALVAAVDWPPDVILLDVMMPGMDGPATLAKLRSNATTANIPVIFMTARAQPREIEIFRSLGASGVIAKPFDPMTLAASVRTYAKPGPGRVKVLLDSFTRRVSNDAAALASHLFTVRGRGLDAETLAGIKGIAHGLAGAGGIYGFDTIGDAAAALEEAVDARPGDAAHVDGIADLVDQLLICIETHFPEVVCSIPESAPR